MTENSKAIVSRIADDIWNRGDLSVIEEIMAADAVYNGPHMPNGVGNRDNWMQAISMYRSAFPDSHVSFEEMLVAGHVIVGRWTATGTHTGQLPGVTTTGKPIVIGGITIYRFANDKIIEAWEQLDLLGMWQQLGVVSLPGH